MRYLSVCSGIEAASVAWHPLGWEPAAFSEIEAFPRAVLKHHYPAVPLHGDFTTIGGDEYGSVGLLVGGTPCQSFSVAGLRGGLADDRGNLALQFLKLADRTRARWVVWENVPGVLSSNGGRDFGSILGGLAELGYGFAYRVLDAQYVRVDGYPRAVPQRRKRVFVVGYFGDWRRAAAVLFEREGMSGHPAPRRKTGQGAVPTLAARTNGGGGLGTDFDCDGGLVPSVEVARTVMAKHTRHDPELESYAIAHTLSARHDSSPQGGWGGTPIIAETQTANGDAHSGHRDECGPVHEVRPINTMVGLRHEALGERTGLGIGEHGDPAFTLSKAHSHAVSAGMSVRRLTPRECERLQGFSDDYTLVPYRGRTAADGPRYKALGNSMAVNVMRWIGRRIAAVEAIPA